MLRLLLPLVLLVLGGAAAQASTPTPRFEQLRADDGLFSDTIKTVIQDRQGYIWLGGFSGLNRYDGNEVRGYRSDPRQPRSLADDSIESLHVDAAGRLWVGSDGGLQRYEPDSDDFTTIALPGPTVSVHTILDDGAGGLWLGTDGGLRRVHRDGTVQSWRQTPGQEGALGNDMVLALARAHDGSLWIGTQRGLDVLAPSATHFRHVDIDPGPAPDVRRQNVRALQFDDQGVLWIGTAAGLERWRGGIDGERQRFGPEHGIDHQRVAAVHRDHQGRIWLTTFDDGVRLWDPVRQRFDAFRHELVDAGRVPQSRPSALWLDRSGTLWVATWGQGVKHADMSSGGFVRLFRTPGSEHPAMSKQIINVRPAPHGKLWLATNGGGLGLFDPTDGSVQVYHYRRGVAGSLPDAQVNTVAYDRHGRLWAGTAAGLVMQRADGSFTAPVVAPATAFDQVVSMQATRDGMLWLGTYNGLLRFDPDTAAVQRFLPDPAHPDGLSHKRVNTLLEDREGVLWIATAGGLSWYDPASGRFRNASARPGQAGALSHGYISTLLEDHAGTIWVGTGNGLDRVKRRGAGKIEFESVVSGFMPARILESVPGELWISSDRGIARLATATGELHQYWARDGLFDGGYQEGSGHRGGDGRLYFGAFGGGLTMFDPRAVRHNQTVPVVLVNGLSIANRPVRPGALPDGMVLEGTPSSPRAVTLAHTLPTITFEFAALHFADVERNRYQYRLAGYDKGWTDASARRPFASYANLDPGRYSFEVRAANKDGVWNPVPAQVTLTVLPPWWESWPVRIAATAALAALAYLAFRTRTAALERRNAMLGRLVGERTRALERAVEDLHNAQRQAAFQDKMAAIGTLTAGVAHEVNNPANFAHAGAQTLVNELEQFRRFLLALAGEEADAEVLAQLNSRIDELVKRNALVLEGTTRIRDLVMDLRTFAREDGPEARPAAVIEHLRATIHLVQTHYQEVAEIVTDFQDAPDVVCWPGKLNQVFMNLIVNACDAIRERRQHGDPGPGRLCIGSRRDGAQLLLIFEDNGCGIPPEVMPRIFDPFFTTKDVGAGTGLGLSISYQIIRQHGGQLNVTSRPGVGSRFEIRLPLAGP